MELGRRRFCFIPALGRWIRRERECLRQLRNPVEMNRVIELT
eukprot:COSAG02_NODE_13677_length_1363_cov_2.854430_1_plen_41_part_10